MLFIAQASHAQTYGQTELTKADELTHQLVAEVTTAVPGKPLGLIWKINLDPHWHIYYKNPGDSGLPPEITTETGALTPLTFPTPKRIDIDPITNYGYENEVMFGTSLTLPEDMAQGPQNISLNLEYLYCKDICLPGSAKLNLPLNIGTSEESNPAYPPLLAQYQSTQPQPWPTSIPLPTLTQNNQTLMLGGLPQGITSAQFIPAEEGQIHDFAPQIKQETTLLLTADEQSLTQPPLSGILILDDKSYVLPELTPTHGPLPQAGRIQGGETALLPILFAAFIAGLILNLMPCVLPVLALKVMGLIKHSTQADRRKYGLGYTLGVLGTFSLFTLAIISLQGAGAQLGWGFHLQNPWFVAGLTTLMLTLALNFWGVMSIGNKLTRLGDAPRQTAPTLTSALSTGALAVIVATPCTVPFMGAAVAYAFTQPALVTWMVFMALGLGLAAPFLLFSLTPKASHLLPKPGVWMHTLKLWLGWPMLATALWLAYVFAGLTHTLALFVLLTFLLIWAAVVWGYGQEPSLSRLLLIVLTLAGGLFSLQYIMGQSTPSHWQPWRPATQAEAQTQGPVFVDFTADWCITCKVVEATVLNRDDVQTLFQKTNTTLLKADWTKQDATITAELAKHGRKGVPLYLVYTQGNAAPRILPQLPSYTDIENALLGR